MIRFVQIWDEIIHFFLNEKYSVARNIPVIGIFSKAPDVEILKRFLVNDSINKEGFPLILDRVSIANKYRSASRKIYFERPDW